MHDEDDDATAKIYNLQQVVEARRTPEKRALAAQLFSDRHRTWGWDCPAVDLDFVPYDRGKPTAIIEYKHEDGPLLIPATIGPFRPIGVLRTLATDAKLPFFVVRYSADFVWFRVRGCNALAKALVPKTRDYTEAEWADFLHRLGPRMRKVANQSRLKGQGRLDV